MNNVTQIEARILELQSARDVDPASVAHELLYLSEQIMCIWLESKDEVPTYEQTEGFRLLALHRQGCKGDPSFNACRETCREMAYHYNEIHADPAHPQIRMLTIKACAVAMHLCLFVGGKLQDALLGDFCCSSRPAQTAATA